MKIEATPEIVRGLVDYNPETGVITWKSRDRKWFKRDQDQKRWNALFAGKVAGWTLSIRNSGLRYVKIQLGDNAVSAHSLAWLFVYGEWPDTVDHINGIGTDNRICNLRSVSQAINARNRKINKNNTSGIAGVHWCEDRNKWRANIRVSGRLHSLGQFEDKFEAICVRKSAERRYGFHFNHGRMTQGVCQ